MSEAMLFTSKCKTSTRDQLYLKDRISFFNYHLYKAALFWYCCQFYLFLFCVNNTLFLQLFPAKIKGIKLEGPALK